MTGVIMAGGKNSRIGLKKAFLEIGGEKNIERIVKIFQTLFRETLIITNTPEEYEYPGCKMFKDIYPGKGPIGGIYTGLCKAKTEKVFVTACDMPFISRDVISRILEEDEKGRYDVVVPVNNERLHPLHALYSTSCIVNLEDAIKENRLKIKNFFREVRVKRVQFDSVDSRSFFNINTLEDYEEAKKNHRLNC